MDLRAPRGLRQLGQCPRGMGPGHDAGRSSSTRRHPREAGAPPSRPATLTGARYVGSHVASPRGPLRGVASSARSDPKTWTTSRPFCVRQSVGLSLASLRHSYDDISLFVSSFDIPMSLGNLLQRIASIDDRL